MAHRRRLDGIRTWLAAKAALLNITSCAKDSGACCRYVIYRFGGELRRYFSLRDGIQIGRDGPRWQHNSCRKSIYGTGGRKELEGALSQIKRLQGLLPICSYCKRIRDDQDYWQQVECYIAEHSEVKFTHGICPECYDKIVKQELQKVGQ